RVPEMNLADLFVKRMHPLDDRRDALAFRGEADRPVHSQGTGDFQTVELFALADIPQMDVVAIRHYRQYLTVWGELQRPHTGFWQSATDLAGGHDVQTDSRSLPDCPHRAVRRQGHRPQGIVRVRLPRRVCPLHKFSGGSVPDADHAIP